MKHSKFKHLLILLLILSPLQLLAQSVVSNVRAMQDGRNVVLLYDLSRDAEVQLVKIEINGKSRMIPATSLSGDVGKKVQRGTNYRIVYNVLEDYPEGLHADDVAFVIEAIATKIPKKELRQYVAKVQKPQTHTKKMKTLVSAQMGYAITPQLNGGLLFGQMYNGVGWYVNMRSNFTAKKKTYYGNVCADEDGKIKGYKPFYTGEKENKTHFIFDAGFMMDFLRGSAQKTFNTFGFYVGGGYGHRNLYLPIMSGAWVKYAPTSTSGFSGNLGLFGSWNRVTLNIGVNTINFKYTDVEFGLGIMF